MALTLACAARRALARHVRRHDSQQEAPRPAICDPGQTHGPKNVQSLGGTFSLCCDDGNGLRPPAGRFGHFRSFHVLRSPRTKATARYGLRGLEALGPGQSSKLGDAGHRDAAAAIVLNYVHHQDVRIFQEIPQCHKPDRPLFENPVQLILLTICCSCSCRGGRGRGRGSSAHRSSRAGDGASSRSCSHGRSRVCYSSVSSSSSFTHFGLCTSFGLLPASPMLWQPDRHGTSLLLVKAMGAP
mmetsp:Transcript_18096/g.38678  ORF Transcript_18096/g.38678 Transcript_18096/m.38678 type:complete len:242 (-) Transcript_18096:92-817(-)